MDVCPKCGGKWTRGQLLTVENPQGGNYGVIWTYDTSNQFFHKQDDLYRVLMRSCKECGYIEMYKDEKFERPTLFGALFG